MYICMCITTHKLRVEDNVLGMLTSRHVYTKVLVISLCLAVPHEHNRWLVSRINQISGRGPLQDASVSLSGRGPQEAPGLPSPVRLPFAISLSSVGLGHDDDIGSRFGSLHTVRSPLQLLLGVLCVLCTVVVPVDLVLDPVYVAFPAVFKVPVVLSVPLHLYDCLSFVFGVVRSAAALSAVSLLHSAPAVAESWERSRALVLVARLIPVFDWLSRIVYAWSKAPVRAAVLQEGRRVEQAFSGLAAAVAHLRRLIPVQVLIVTVWFGLVLRRSRTVSIGPFVDLQEYREDFANAGYVAIGVVQVFSRRHRRQPADFLVAGYFVGDGFGDFGRQATSWVQVALLGLPYMFLVKKYHF